MLQQLQLLLLIRCWLGLDQLEVVAEEGIGIAVVVCAIAIRLLLLLLQLRGFWLALLLADGNRRLLRVHFLFASSNVGQQIIVSILLKLINAGLVLLLLLLE